MKDIEGNEFQINDWLLGNIQYGKICNITQDDRVMYLDVGGFVRTVTKEDVRKYRIKLHPYSSIRRSYLAKQLPDDFFTAEELLMGCDGDNSNKLYYFGDLLVKACWRCSRRIDELDIARLSGYKEAAGKALSDNEDEERFIDDMAEWFRHA